MRRRPAQSLRCSCLPHHEDFAVRGRVRRVCNAESSSRRDNSARTYAPQAGLQALPRAGCVPDVRRDCVAATPALECNFYHVHEGDDAGLRAPPPPFSPPPSHRTAAARPTARLAHGAGNNT